MKSTVVKDLLGVWNEGLLLLRLLRAFSACCRHSHCQRLGLLPDEEGSVVSRVLPPCFLKQMMNIRGVADGGSESGCKPRPAVTFH